MRTCPHCGFRPTDHLIQPKAEGAHAVTVSPCLCDVRICPKCHCTPLNPYVGACRNGHRLP